MWRVSGIPKQHQKKYQEIGRKRDWSWVAPENKAFEPCLKRGCIVIEGISYLYRRPYITEKAETERLKYILVWISLVVEKLGIQEEIQHGVFEDICSYI